MNTITAPGLFVLLLSTLVTSIALPAQELDSGEKAALLKKTSDSMIAGRYEQAIESLTTLANANPESATLQMTLGDAWFMSGQMKNAIASYDRAIDQLPRLEPRCWQRGLAYYYNGDFELGRQQFEIHQTHNRQDVENAVWHMLCVAGLHDIAQARDSMISIDGDHRVPMAEIFRLFAGDATVETVLTAAGNIDSANDNARDTQMYYAYLYIGLFYEMTGDLTKAAESMKKASDINPIPKNRLMGSVADVHLRLRDPENRK